MPVIKRYPNRKLYDTKAKKYITLDGIAVLIRDGEEVTVTDHASGEDLTALTLTQIIFEQEKKKSGLLPNSILTGLIRSSGDRITSIQRTLFSSTFWHQIDDEIKLRVRKLVKMEKMSASEGKEMIEQLLSPDIRGQGSSQETGSPQSTSTLEIEKYLNHRQAPTQDDLHRLHIQLEELAAKLEEINPRETP